jgi:thiol-disulfide isomerase/thioredoxin
MDFGSLFSNRYVLIGLLSLIFIIIGYYFYTRFVKSEIPTITDDIYDDGDVKGGVAEIMFFHADWCPHCKTAKPEWEKLKKEYNNKVINGYEVIFIDYNCTEESDEITQKLETYKVEGFPTIKLKVDGRVVEFDAKVNKDNMEKFLSTVLSQ